MINKDRVSVVISCFNASSTISKCIDSLLFQTYKNIEILACDDCSSDNTFDILLTYSLKYSNVIVLKNEQNLGAAASRNKCIEISTGEFIAIQDADDFSSSNRIEEQVRFLKDNTEFSFVSSDANLFSDDTYSITGLMKAKHLFPKKKHFLWGPPFIHPSTLFTRVCLEKVNGYRVCEETRRGQDYDMFMRMYACGFIGANLHQPLYWYRLDKTCVKRHGKSSSRNEYLVRINGFRMLKLMPIGYVFALKPYFANFLHRLGWFRYK